MKYGLLVTAAVLSACGPVKGGGFDVIVTGEDAATLGIPFPAASDGAPYFQDGWSLSFSDCTSRTCCVPRVFPPKPPHPALTTGRRYNRE